MVINRRQFSLITALSGGLMAEPSVGAAWARELPPIGSHGSDFWTSDVRKASKALTLQEARRRSKLMKAPFPGTAINSGREPVFLFYDAANRKLVDSSTITPTIKSGDVNVVMRVLRFRPSTSDSQKFERMKSGSLRIDLQQEQVSPDIGEKMAWSVIAGLLPGANGKLPDFSSLSFDPGTAWGQLSSVPLPGGWGQWTWNFFVQNKESLLGQIFSQAHNAIQNGALAGFFSLLGLPAIAITALYDVDKLLDYFLHKTNVEYLFQSTNKPVVATQDTVTSLGIDTIHLTTGTYLIVPEAHTGSVDTSYCISSKGFYVPPNTSFTQEYKEYLTAAPDVTYLTVYVQVSPKTAKTAKT